MAHDGDRPATTTPVSGEERGATGHAGIDRSSPPLREAKALREAAEVFRRRAEALERGRARRQYAPLEPDAFLRWAWERGDREPGTSPLTLDDLVFEYGGEIPREQLHRDYVRLAALVRRNQRLGNPVWEGIR